MSRAVLRSLRAWPAVALVIVACSVVNNPDEPIDPAAVGGNGQGANIPLSCGDGVVQDPETCDDGGFSSGCDNDCTPAECGDGVVNALAGEACDGALPSAECDIDCTPVACGDGEANDAAGEVCDDGNTLSDDGCDDQCAVEGTCSAPVAFPLDEPVAGFFDGWLEAGIAGGPNQVPASSCGSGTAGGGSDRVYSIEIAQPGPLYITAYADFDVALRLTTAACDPGQQLADGLGDGCSNAGGDSVIEELRYFHLDNGTYFLHVDGAEEDAAGTFTLHVQSFTGTSCADLINRYADLPSGAYGVDPDGPGSDNPFGVYCDMDADVGLRGWALVARFSNADEKNWMLDTGEWWYSKVTPAGSPFSRSENADMISPAFANLVGSYLRISRTDNPNDFYLGRISCLSGRSVREMLFDFGGPTSWGPDTVAGSCSASYANNFAATGGFAQAQCAGDIGNSTGFNFFAHRTIDSAVISIGGVGSACGYADHGIGVTAADTNQFADTTTENDFGDSSSSSGAPSSYALNMWVR
jgi:cysteine-rich repeat protein